MEVPSLVPMSDDHQQPTTNVACSLCDECHSQPSKYKCPSCGIRSCCLACVKTHKVRTSCTGKRNRSSYVPLSCFDDSCLISDYTYLEEVLRDAESAKRLEIPGGRKRQVVNGRWTVLRKQARKRKINLLYLSQGMTRRDENTSRYCKRRRSILWRIEFVFHLTDIRLVDNCAGESLSPAKMLKNQLVATCCSAAVQNFLRQLCKEPVECMRYLLVKEPSLAEHRCFVELDPSKPLGSQLTDMTIVEFPIIHVMSPCSTSNVTVVKDLKFTEVEVEDATEKTVDDFDMVKGSHYREEEIKDDDKIEVEVVDATQKEKTVDYSDMVKGSHYREEEIKDDDEIEEGEIVE